MIFFLKYTLIDGLDRKMPSPFGCLGSSFIGQSVPLLPVFLNLPLKCILTGAWEKFLQVCLTLLYYDTAEYAWVCVCTYCSEPDRASAETLAQEISPG